MVVLAVIAYIIALITQLANEVGILITITITPPYILLRGKVLSLYSK